MGLSTLSEISNLWQRILEGLSKDLDKMVFDAFLKDSYIYSIEGDKIIVGCNSDLSENVLNEQYKDPIVVRVNKETGSNFTVVFVNSEKLKNKNATELVNKSEYKFFNNIKLDQQFTFDSFVVGPSNKEASQAALIAASNPGKFYNPLFIYGGSGLGKTHLLNAIGNYVKERQPTTKILYVTAQDFIYQYIDYANSANKDESLSKFIKSFDMLLLDDVQMMKDKKKTLEFFFDIYQYLLQNHKQIVLTSDRLPSELDGIDARLVSRFMDGLTVQIERPSSEMCQDILKKKIIDAGLDVDEFDPEVIVFVADKFKSSIRELNGALNRIIFIKNLRHADHIDINLTCEALANLINVSDAHSKVNEQKILNVVSNYFNISVNQMTGKLKTGQIANARHVAIYLMRNLLNISLKQIGELFSNRDHTTIMHSVSKVEELLKNDQQTKIAINEIKNRLKA
jgi:chromosomal replication initiator protein